jgi:hypothetical protein
MHRSLAHCLVSLMLAGLLAGCGAAGDGSSALPFPLDDATVAPTTAPAPTAAPTPAPVATDAPAPAAESAIPAPPAAATGPVVIQGAGQKTAFAGEYSCTAPAQEVRLTVNADSAAQLFVSGSGFIDHVNCTPSTSIEGWYVEGVANPGDETVAFTTCNMGNFAAEGTVSYAGGALAGEATCLYSKGSAAGTRAIQVTMP